MNQNNLFYPYNQLNKSFSNLSKHSTFSTDKKLFQSFFNK
jgi:hypothetical protein